ncbi:MAG: MBL fold metallo-hydrolase, partial [Planctomycetota bacterium]|nr:MBL fold metallo-hydrolase [Planctomycetota bacterium]
MNEVSEFRIEFLGTGTSAGIPCIGCDCDTCRSTDPRDARLRCGAALRFVDPLGQPRTILIDIPPDHRQQALRHGLDRCDGILVTHAHVDHIFGLDEVRRYNTLMRAPIGIHAEPGVLEALHRIYPHIYAQHHNVNPSYVADLYDVVLTPGTAMTLHGLRIEPIRLLHGKLPILGFR